MKIWKNYLGGGSYLSLLRDSSQSVDTGRNSVTTSIVA